MRPKSVKAALRITMKSCENGIKITTSDDWYTRCREYQENRISQVPQVQLDTTLIQGTGWCSWGSNHGYIGPQMAFFGHKLWSWPCVLHDHWLGNDTGAMLSNAILKVYHLEWARSLWSSQDPTAGDRDRLNTKVLVIHLRFRQQ